MILPNQVRPMRSDSQSTGSVSSPGSMGHPTGSTDTADKKPDIYKQPGLDPVNSRAPKPNEFGVTKDLDKVQAEPTPRKMPEIEIS